MYPKRESFVSFAKESRLSRASGSPLQLWGGSWLHLTHSKANAAQGNVALLKLLVAIGGSAQQAHPGPPGSEAFDGGWLPIHTACRRGQLEAARFLLEQGLGTAFQTDRRGRTPLHSLLETDDGSTQAKVGVGGLWCAPLRAACRGMPRIDGRVYEWGCIYGSVRSDGSLSKSEGP